MNSAAANTVYESFVKGFGTGLELCRTEGDVYASHYADRKNTDAEVFAAGVRAAIEAYCGWYDAAASITRLVNGVSRDVADRFVRSH